MNISTFCAEQLYRYPAPACFATQLNWIYYVFLFQHAELIKAGNWSQFIKIIPDETKLKCVWLQYTASK